MTNGVIMASCSAVAIGQRPRLSSRGFYPCPPQARNRLAEHLEHQLGEPVVQARDDDHHEEHEDQAHHRVGDELLAGRPDHLAELGDHLPEEQGGGGPVRALSRTPGSAPFLRGLAACLSRHILTYWFAGKTVWPDRTRRAGGTRTPNHRFWRPGLWPIELLPSDSSSTALQQYCLTAFQLTLLSSNARRRTRACCRTTARLPVHAVYVRSPSESNRTGSQGGLGDGSLPRGVWGAGSPQKEEKEVRGEAHRAPGSLGPYGFAPPGASTAQWSPCQPESPRACPPS